MTAQRAIFSRRQTAIHSLPVELLTRIFVLGAGFDDPYADSPFLLKPEQAYIPMPSSNFQLVVSHVCQHWRQVALRAPHLWTTLHFREKPHIERAREYLTRCTRSTTFLLDILFDSVSEEDHTPGVTLYKHEVRTIFQTIIPHVKRWRSFHLKICDNDCKGLARQFLGTCGPAPNLETLQLYHFEDYRTTQNLYLATYRPPVIVFNNTLPRLRNLSLIGVNLPWEKSPFLMNLQNLELALHPDNIRPPFRWWRRMLQMSPKLETLCLHYSGPKTPSGDKASEWPTDEEKISLPQLKELSLTDLDPDYLCSLLEHLNIRAVKTLSLDLPDQDFTGFVDLLTRHSFDAEGVSDNAAVRHTPITSLSSLDTLIIHALECSWSSWVAFFKALRKLRKLEVDFTRVGTRFWRIFVEDCSNHEAQFSDRQARINSSILPHLEDVKISGIPGKYILDGLRHIYHPSRIHNYHKEAKWLIGWTEKRRGADVELDALIDRGYWSPVTGCTEPRVLIEPFDDEDDELVEEAENEDISIGSDEDSESADRLGAI